MLSPYNLLCEYAPNPLGTDTGCPRLSWKLSDERPNQCQSAYRITAAPSRQLLESGQFTWDSGKIESSESIGISWGAQTLGSRQRIYWQVRCWDADGVCSNPSEVAWFETALLHAEDWVADWIGYPVGWPERALYLRLEVPVDKPLERARFYVSGLGYHELYINGCRLGDDMLDPAYTDINKTVMYRTFDITENLNQGSNVAAAIVGHGWHGFPRLIGQLELTYSDGTVKTFGQLGSNWSACHGPVIQNGIYAGETYDARKERPGWNLPGETGAYWLGALPVAAPAGRMTAQMIEPIRIMQSIEPVSIKSLANGDYVVDLGQNIAGWVRIKLEAERGQTVTMRFAETLYKDGSVNQENLRDFCATDRYIAKGEGQEVWEPRFTYHGFRYVQVEGYPGELTCENITGRVVRSSVDTAGSFSASNSLLNQIQKIIWWTEQDNYHGIPTDCPQRNERMGWLNDLVARDEESLYNFDLSRFMSKWLKDIRESQNPESGGVPLTAPRGWLGATDPTEPVTVSYLELAWLLYRHYGDRRSLEESYPGLQMWLNKMQQQAEDSIIYYAPIADWAPPVDHITPGTQLSGAPAELMATAFFFWGAKLLDKIARILDKPEDAEKFLAIAEQVKQAFNRKFWREDIGGYATNSQSCNCCALQLGLVPEEHLDSVVRNLVQKVVSSDYHLTTGNVCTKYLLETLTRTGHGDVALKVALQTTYPSWGYMIANGATTVWERWENETGPGMNSHNHPMMASVGSWFYKFLAGINPAEDACGFDNIEFTPYVVEGLDSAVGRYESVRGTVECGWKRIGKEVKINVKVPVGCTATLQLPGLTADIRSTFNAAMECSSADGCKQLCFGSGDYEFIAS